ncbi:RICIN domain-containing protein [Streptomyces sp. NPDC002537]
MKKKALAHLAAAAVIAPLAVVVTSGEASARDGERVTWRNVATKRCLNTDGHSEVRTLPSTDCKSGFEWIEHAIKETSDGQGIYRISVKPSFPDNLCLDSSDAGRVYLNKCNEGKYQMWWQQKTPKGWRIVNYQTGLSLDSSDAGRVYTNKPNSSDYQLWK